MTNKGMKSVMTKRGMTSWIYVLEKANGNTVSKAVGER
jgi:hypothetical protein